MLGEHDTAAAHARDALTAAEESGNAIAIGLAQYDVGFAWEFRGDGQRAAEAYRPALHLLQDAGATAYAAWVQAELANKLVWLGKLDEAVPMLDDALVRLRAAGPAWGMAMALGQRAHAALYQANPVLAAQFFRESIEAAREVGYERVTLGAVAGLAGVALAVGQPERAARLLGATEVARKAIGSGRIAHALHAERIVSAAREALGEPGFAQAFAAGGALTLDEAITEAVTLADDLTGTTPELTA